MMLSRGLLSAVLRSATAAASPLLQVGAAAGVDIQSLRARFFRSRFPEDRQHGRHSFELAEEDAQQTVLEAAEALSDEWKENLRQQPQASPTKSKGRIRQGMLEACRRQDFRHAFRILQDNQWSYLKEYHHLIFLCCQNKEFELAWKVLLAIMQSKDKAVVRKLHPKATLLFHLILKAHVRCDEAQVACGLFLHFLGEEPDVPLPSWLEELAYHEPKGQGREALKLLPPVPFRLIPEQKTFNSLVHHCEWEKNGWFALELLKIAARRRIPLSQDSLNCAVRACARENEIENANRVIQHMAREGMQIDLTSFLCLLEAQRDKGYPAEETLALMTKCGLDLSVQSIGAAGKYTEALAHHDSVSAGAIDQDRPGHDVDAVIEALIRQRGKEEGEHDNIKSYLSAMDAVRLQKCWPVVHYLFEEAIFKTDGDTIIGAQFLGALTRTMEEEEVSLENSENSHFTRRPVRHIALKAYRLAVAKGWVSHFETHSPWTIDVHQYSTYHAHLAVEMVLENLAADLLEGKTKEMEDLEIITGREVHSAVSGPRAEESGASSEHNMTLRKKLADILLSERLLSFVDVSFIYKHPGGTIVVDKEKIETWIRRYNWDQKQRQGRELLLD